MFTGIIEHVGSIAAIRPNGGEAVLEVDIGPLAEGVRIGDSIATDGVCLTVETLDGSVVRFTASAETLRKTILGGFRPGRPVNLERALKVGDRLGGHLVAGHVDGIGRLLERRREGDAERFTFVLPETVKVVEKGSLAINGISLTTWDCRGQRCSVAVIPHTLGVTTLGALRPGDPVNLEQDLIGRWVERLMPGRG
jgi:riboflavin synthase